MTQPHPTAHIPELVQRLYAIVQELEHHFPDRPFTPDGHLVGSIGEVLAAYYYGLTLLPCSSEAHDAKAPDGRRVQIKATQGSSVAMRAACDHLIVIKLFRTGSIQEIYNGPGSIAWETAGLMQKNGQRPISLTRLKSLMANVSKTERLPTRELAVEKSLAFGSDL